MNRRSGERGFILASLYMVLVVLLIHSVALITHALGAVRMAQRSQAQMQALYLAEAGVDAAIVQLRADSTWVAGFAAVAIGATGDYTVTVDNTLPGNNIRLFSSGTTSLAQFNNTQSLDVIVQVAPQSLFRYAAFGYDYVRLNGNAETDSYNSSEGAYDPLTAGANGDVGSNGITPGSIQLNGNNVVVGGDAWVGQGGDPGVAITTTGSPTITGNQAPLSESQPMPPVVIPPELVNQGDLNVAGSTNLEIAGGTYWYNDVEIKGNGQINFTGPTVLYLTGKLKVGGNGIGTAGSLPPNLVVYVAGDDHVRFSGGADFYGAIYAPESHIYVNGNGDLFGSAIGDQVRNNGNAEIHYDEDLLNVAGSGGQGSVVSVISWTDQSVVPLEVAP